MQHLVSSLDEDVTSAEQLAKSVTILDAIRWINQAWMLVRPDTIQKCFKNCGIHKVRIFIFFI